MSKRIKRPRKPAKNIAEERLNKFFSKNTMLAIEVAYRKNEAALQFKVLLDVDQQNFFRIVHEIWEGNECKHKKLHDFLYDPEISAGDANAVYDSIKLDSDS